MREFLLLSALLTPAVHAATCTARDARLYLALYENRLSSRITASENAQRTLQHDYVCVR